jgi:hypothetical protein
MAEELRRRSKLLDDALSYLARQVKEYAEAERAYRESKARAWVEAPEGTAGAKDAWVGGVTAEKRKARDLADGMRQAGLEAVRSRRAQLSAWQSLAAMERSEMELAKYGPEVAP